MASEEEFMEDVNSGLTEWLSDYILGKITPDTWRCETSRSVHMPQVRKYLSKKLNDRYQGLFGRGVSLSEKVGDITHDSLAEMGYVRRDKFGIYDLKQDSMLYFLDHANFPFEAP